MTVSKPLVRPYKRVGDTTLNMHIIGPEGARDGSAPAVVFFFCGGWSGFDASKFFPQSVHLASRGMVCFNAEVRVEPVHGTTPVECVVDGKSAVRWVRAHAAELGIDEGRVAAAGGSAGGHVAACCGVVDGFDDPQDENLSISSRPDAMVLFNPVLDTTTSERRINLFGGYEAALSLSPIQHVRSGDPPSLVLHGRDDERVEVDQATRFAEAMAAAGNRCDVRLYEGQGHGFFNFLNGRNPMYTETLREMDVFLTSLGYLEQLGE